MSAPTVTVPTVPAPRPRPPGAPQAGRSAVTVARHAPRPAPAWGGPVWFAPRTTGAATPKLGRRALRREQQVTLHAARRRYSLAARLLFVTMDLLYGRRRTLEKFLVLEIVARIPYQVWESAAYRAITRRHHDSGLARRIRARIVETREQQDNEQWHLLIVGELVAAGGGARSRFRYRVVPWLMAVGWYHASWLMFVLRPSWSYRLNADFEDHAEHEYAQFVAEHPELETVAHGSPAAALYGALPSTADLLRQIGHDERMHKQESEAYLAQGRMR